MLACIPMQELTEGLADEFAIMSKELEQQAMKPRVSDSTELLRCALMNTLFHGSLACLISFAAGTLVEYQQGFKTG